MSDKKRKLEESSEDEVVLSHAAQRRRRKRLKLEESQPDDPPTTEQKPSTTSKFSIWVGNLAFKTDPSALKTFFGDLASQITRIHLPTKALHGSNNLTKSRGENKGFAYIDFATAEAKTTAIKKTEEPLDGRRLLIKDGNDFVGRPFKEGQTVEGNPHPLTGLTKTARKILSEQPNPPCSTLFLGNLSFETTTEEIAALFGRAHPKSLQQNQEGGANEEERIKKVRMGTFEDSGKCKGFAFVDFNSVDFATQALTTPRNHSLNGRALVVQYATPDAVRRGTTTRHNEGQERNPSSKGSRRPQKSERIAAKAKALGLADESGEKPAITNSTNIAKRPMQQNKRIRPGAALSQAPRESVAIVESLGKKTVFT